MQTTVLWLDGCFDGFHYAHANAFRQARKLVDGPVHMMAAVHSDEEIMKHKGPPLFDEKERYAVVAGCRWVDEVIEGAPYITQLHVLDKHHVDFLVHGDDAVVDATGSDIYAPLKLRGKYKEFKRTEGISTTSLIQRVLDHPRWEHDSGHLDALLQEFLQCIPARFPVVDLSAGDNQGSPAMGTLRGKKVYVGGAWDSFGSGHVHYLRRAKELISPDTAVIVGVWADKTVEEVTGEKPLLAQIERVLAVVQCKYTDAVLYNVPASLPLSSYLSLGIDIAVNENIKEEGPNIVQVEHIPVPPFQTPTSLRARVEARLGAYKERQRRKQHS
ncbi:Nucleotidylyl transferase [Gloeophyllum trabeum ATCC 11539]|uniref:ethanolamine-phosphate cytidylyltransferase n=1 Tax=Gloeophyllum trabeum (strain ATCC 11539 / FP-39264 / Madison 617) TaxID=670483 RepID=S7QP00_GLOTA|nr:Nucleotidylyl transferase [Gloeophyllum trabeum ATCC 11539]EPQ61027.1 Nucleotidylyl transferase [Gloeophyllum trabeum ATCC 11539]